jgi:cytidylate kinase
MFFHPLPTLTTKLTTLPNPHYSIEFIIMIIAIDGPAGSGKSTVAKLVAKELGFIYIDTGAMYRALTLKAMRMGIDLKNESVLIEMAQGVNIRFEEAFDNKSEVFLDGTNVSDKIRLPEVTNNISYIADVPGVRRQMVKLQRSIGHSAQKGAVLEGRDIGTVVFPDASKKFYLDASIKERARRRYNELIENGINADLIRIEEDIKIRDTKDKTRKVGTLKKADDAVLIDATELTIGQVVNKILSYINDKD